MELSAIHQPGKLKRLTSAVKRSKTIWFWSLVAAVVIGSSYSLPAVRAYINGVKSGSPASGSGHNYRQPAAAASGLVGYWPLDGNALDKSGKGNNGTVNGASVTSGKFGKAYQFVSSESDNISLGNPAILLPDSITVTAYFKTSTAALMQVVRKGSYGYCIYLDATGKVVSGVWESSGNELNPASTLSYNDGKWHQATGTYDGTTMKLYIDGQYINQEVGSGTGVIYYGAGNVVIGREGNSVNHPFNGDIDEVRIFNRALSAAEVTDLYKGSNPPPVDQSAVGYWNLDEPSGNTVRDITLKNANNLTDYNSVTQAAGVGGTGYAAQFTATNSEYLSRSYAAGSNLDSGAFPTTVAAWVYFDSVSGEQTIATNEFPGYILRLNGGKLQFFYGNDYNVYANNYGVVPTATWCFVVGWYNNSNDTAYISVNDGTVDSTGSIGGGSAGAGTFSIGQRGNGSYMDGRIANVGVWRRILTAAEITDLYNSGAGKTYAQITAAEKASLVSYWNLDEASGTRFDSHAGVGLISGATRTEGVYQSGYKFAVAGSQYISIADNASLEGMAKLTITAWVRKSAQVDNTYYPIVAKWNNSSDYSYWFGVRNDKFHTQFRVSGDGYDTQRSDTSIPLDQWVHLAAVYAADGSRVKMYVNGRLVTSMEATGGSAQTDTIATNTAPLKIGTYDANYTSAEVDEVRLYNRAFADYEIYEQYLAGRSNM